MKIKEIHIYLTPTAVEFIHKWLNNKMIVKLKCAKTAADTNIFYVLS